jgi:hypothetical protein
MTDVTETAEAVADIWPYVQQLVQAKLVSDYVFENGSVEKVYRNDTSSFDHVLLPTNDENVLIIIVVALENKTIFGHYNLDLRKEYGLT